MRQVAITGASRGIGRAIAQRFAADGWRVWGLVRDVASLSGLTGDVHGVAFDAASEPSVLAAAARLNQEPPLDALINNAGIALSAPLAKTSTEDFLRLQAINVTAPFLLCRELAPAMVKAGQGRIINIASTAGKKGLKYTAAYCASKHALLGLTKALALELAPKGVTVAAVLPGWTDTDMFTQSIDRIVKVTGRSKEDARATLEKLNPIGRAIKPEEVAEVVHFMCASAAGAAMIGAEVVIDGGEIA